MSMTVGKLIEAYIQLRDKRDALRDRHKQELAPLNKAMAAVEDKLQQVMQSMDLDNLKSKAGTAYMSTRTSVTVDDWDAFLSFVRDNDAWHLLERRASKTAVEEVTEDTGELPPGLSMKRALRVNVQRS